MNKIIVVLLLCGLIGSLYMLFAAIESEAFEPIPVVLNATEQEVMLSLNEYRLSKGLIPVVAEKLSCSLASERAVESVSDWSHEGFRKRVKTKTLPYKNHARAGENLAKVKSYKNVIKNWIASPKHNELLLADYTYGCVKQSGSNWAFEAWEPKK